MSQLNCVSSRPVRLRALESNPLFRWSESKVSNKGNCSWKPLAGQGTIRRMPNLTSLLNQLEQERNRLAHQLESLNNAISALNGTTNNRTGRTISAAGRARIAAAQRARWAKAKGKAGSSAKRTRRPLSPAGRKRIIAATKARWAAWRRDQKAA